MDNSILMLQEIVLQIFEYVADFHGLNLVCKEWATVTEYVEYEDVKSRHIVDIFWKNMIKRDFPSYTEEYLQQRDHTLSEYSFGKSRYLVGKNRRKRKHKKNRASVTVFPQKAMHTCKWKGFYIWIAQRDNQYRRYYSSILQICMQKHKCGNNPLEYTFTKMGEEVEFRCRKCGFSHPIDYYTELIQNSNDHLVLEP